MREYAEFDGLGLAELVRKGDVSPAELAEAAIDRIERHNGALNAVVYKAYDEARAVAKGDLTGPFAGVPFLVKDLGVSVAGWPGTSGSKFCKDLIDEADSGLVKRYRESGVVILGKTNTPEFGITGTTESALFGPCRNPWNTDHIAGGSSGGAAASVAAGIVPLAHASDGLGSIRIPAACCGLVGLKVTRDRNPNLPDGFDYTTGMVVDHVVTRTVRDCAAMLDVTGVPEPGSPYATPPKARPYMEEIAAHPGKLRIAYSRETATGRPIDPEVEAALQATAEMLKKLGHDVFPRGLGVDYRAFFNARGASSGGNFASELRRAIDRVGREPREDELEPLSWTYLNAGRRALAGDALYGMQELRKLSRTIVRQFEEFDVYLTPVMGAPPPKIGFISTVHQDARELNKRQSAAFPFTPWFNFTGQPSLSLPLAMSQTHLPIGMMFTARYADEATLFRLAAQLEKEAPWNHRRPPIWN